MRKRTKARHIVLQTLYQIDLCHREFDDEMREFVKVSAKDAHVEEFALELLAGMFEHKEEIDEKIRSVAKNWDLERMANIDRNVLRIGTYELLFRDDIPPKVSINEAIELAKNFSTNESGLFVNGILDKIKQLKEISNA